MYMNAHIKSHIKSLDDAFTYTHVCICMFIHVSQCILAYIRTQVLSSVDVTILARTISFTSWIKTTPQFLRGYLVCN